jgi:hypothetical protein
MKDTDDKELKKLGEKWKGMKEGEVAPSAASNSVSKDGSAPATIDGSMNEKLDEKTEMALKKIEEKKAKVADMLKELDEEATMIREMGSRRTALNELKEEMNRLKEEMNSIKEGSKKKVPSDDADDGEAHEKKEGKKHEDEESKNDKKEKHEDEVTDDDKNKKKPTTKKGQGKIAHEKLDEVEIPAEEVDKMNENKKLLKESWNAFSKTRKLDPKGGKDFTVVMG